MTCVGAAATEAATATASAATTTATAPGTAGAAAAGASAAGATGTTGTAATVVIMAIGCALQHGAEAKRAADSEVEAEVGGPSAVVHWNFGVAAALYRRDKAARGAAVDRAGRSKLGTVVVFRVLVDVSSGGDVIRRSGADDQVGAGGDFEGRAPRATEDGVAACIEAGAAVVDTGVGVAGGNAVGVAVGKTQRVEAE